MKVANTLIILFVLFITGCVSTSQIEETDLANMQTSKVATNFFIANERIHYTETLYRVLWLETKTSSMDLSGIWDSKTDILNLVDESVSSLGINSLKISNTGTDDELLRDYVAGLNKDYDSNSIEIPETPETKLQPSSSYFSKYPTYNEFENLRISLLNNGVDFLFEYLSPEIYGNAIGYGIVQIIMPSQLRIIDLKNKKVIWNYSGIAVEQYQLGGDLKELEKNNLAILKKGIRAGVTNVLSKDLHGPTFGVKEI
ncbi:hypothetical protein [Psychromonas aquimarina]|uniref:hypothetical protein n=1 Tax=Psychromonas aquimarina TaxID=444919 RepID=UPI000413ECC1|nr:hypothetical protein [Psychromonas aquimarina]